MALHRLLGVQKIDFVNQSNERIVGTKLHTAFQESNVDGLCVASFFCKPEIVLPSGLKANMELDISFNRRGKIESVRVVAASTGNRRGAEVSAQ